MASANRMLRKGSTGPDVKMLQGLLNQKVPQAKLPQGKKLVEDGIFGSNSDAAVRTYQKSNPPLVVDGIVGPKTWSVLGVTYTGPGAIPPQAPPPPPGPVKTPVFEQKTANSGFDSGPTPSWQMVPVNGQKTVILKNADGLQVVSRLPGIASVEDDPKCFVHGSRELIIKGKMKGTTFIDVKNGATVLASLEVSVKNKKIIKAAFHVMSDTGGHKSKLSTASVPGWVTTMNKIFMPQANIEVLKQRAIDVKLAKDLGQVVRFVGKKLIAAGVSKSEHEWDIVTAKGDASADFNVFFVWEYEQDINPNHDDTDAGTLGKNCICEDSNGPNTGETLAHELGHTLGCDDVYDAIDKPLLMYGVSNRTGTRIKKADINIMNP